MIMRVDSTVFVRLFAVFLILLLPHIVGFVAVAAFDAHGSFVSHLNRDRVRIFLYKFRYKKELLGAEWKKQITTQSSEIV